MPRIAGTSITVILLGATFCLLLAGYYGADILYRLQYGGGDAPPLQPRKTTIPWAMTDSLPSQLSNIINHAAGRDHYDLVVGLSHHKTGTFQLRCLMHHFANATGLKRPLGPCFKDNTVTATDMLACMKWHDNDAGYAGRRPVMFKSYHGLQQTCVAPSDSLEEMLLVRPCLSHIITRVEPCSQESVQRMLRPIAADCKMDLPPADVRTAYFNIVRNPIDAVLSAYTYHCGSPEVEKWLFVETNVSVFADQMQWAGADEDTLHQLRLSGQKKLSKQKTYVQLLTKLPPELGVIFEFWHSLPEVSSIARQYQILGRNPYNMNVRFEDLRDSYNATTLQIIQHLKLIPDATKILEKTLTGGCDPGTWTAQQREENDHVTNGKESDAKEVAEAALMGYPPAKRILCHLCKQLNYEDPRCSNDDGGVETGETDYEY